MIFSASQIVGLVEIEIPSNAGSGCLTTTGCEEESLAGFLTWLAGPMARPAVAVEADPPLSGPVNRFGTLLAGEPPLLMAADLGRLELELVDATAEFRHRLAAISASQ